MEDIWERLWVICFLVGTVGTIAGSMQCIKGHTYGVAAHHESTTTGRVREILGGKGGPLWVYVFTVNDVKFNDSSDGCDTPLEPHGCQKGGLVLVHYSFEPYRVTRLREFSAVSTDAYRIGVPALSVGLFCTLTYTYHNPEEQMGDYTRDFGNRKDAEEWADSYKNETVKAHVDPRNPTRSVLMEAELDL